MALFDQIMGGLAAKDTQHAALYTEVGNLVAQSGGVSGLAQQFQQKGLGGLISGWIGTGPNPAISGEQVIQVLGKDKILAMASKAGLTEDQVTNGISKLLPVVVDHLTPNGTATNQTTQELAGALGALKAKLFAA
ncbi:MAG: YidB family protein [Methylacidiphilales bacterium]|nr:YidB family protein [Candidatus Methylacidiphilales bacterium]